MALRRVPLTWSIYGVGAAWACFIYLMGPISPVVAEALGVPSSWAGLLGTAMALGAMTAAFLGPAAVRRCVEAGLRSIHPQSDYAAVLEDVLAAYDADSSDWKQAWRAVETKWGARDLCPRGRRQPFNIDAKSIAAGMA